MNKYTYFVGFLFLNLYAINSQAVTVKVINNAPVPIAAIPVVYTSNGLTYVSDLVFTIPSTQPPAGFVGNYIATPGEVTIEKGKGSLVEVIFIELKDLPGVLERLKGALNTLAKASSYTAPQGTWDAALLTQIGWNMGDTLKDVLSPTSTLAFVGDKTATIKSITFTVDYGIPMGPIVDAVKAKTGGSATPEQINEAIAFLGIKPKLKATITGQE